MPPDAAVAARRSLGLAPDAPLRIAYVAGPGDAVGTFDHWSRGAHDPRTPVVAYSSMFYSLIDGLGAEALLLVEQDRQPASPDPRFGFIHTPRRRDRRGLTFRLDERAFAADVVRHLRAWRADVILVGTDAPDSLIAKLPAARRIILTAHNTFWPMGRRPSSVKARLKLWSKTRALRRIDTAVNTSGECAAQVAALGGPTGARSLTEIPQVLPAFFPATLAPAPTARRLLYLGRIEADKGVFDLLGAFTALAKGHPDLTLDIAGTGSADAALSAAIAASPVRDRISFHGLLPARGVHDRLDAADLLICPTRTTFAEGLALVVVEAAVHGVPTLLSSNVPAKALLPGACAEFPADDTEALTTTLRRIVQTPADYAALCASLAGRREMFRDRTRSWGSMLYRALIA